MKRKLFCVWMCIAMIVTLMPSMAFAEDTSLSTEADIDMENEAVASPEVQAASTSNAIAGSIAVVSWDENGQESYDTSGVTMQVCPGASTEYCVIGTGTGDAFQPMQEMPDTCTISAVKDGSGSVQTKNDPSEADPLYAGAVIAWYKQEEAALYIGYNQDAILLGTESYGDYHISITWTQNEKTYEASTTLTLQPAASLVRGIFRSGLENYEKENGFLRTWYTREQLDTNEEKQFRLTYAPYYDYQEKYTMLYSDEAHGILSFTGSNCDIDGLFTPGEAVMYKEGLEITPLQIDYSNLTAEMIDQSYTLTFSSTTGQTVTCNVVVTPKNELEELVDGQVYLVRDGIVKEDGRLYIYSQDEAVQDLVISEFTGRVKFTFTGCFFGIWDEVASCFKPVDVSCEDSKVTMRGKGQTGYDISAAQVTSGSFRTKDGQSIPYTFSFPEAGFYRMPARTSENYLGDEIYLAEETVTDGHYRFYYMVQAKDSFQKGELDVTHRQMEGVTVSTADDWTDSVNNQTYYVWEVQVDSQATFDEEFWIELSGQKSEQSYYRQDWLTIHDTDVVPKNQRLYWFNASEVQVDADGAIQLRDEAGGSVDEYASFEENWTIRTGNIKSYFAVKRDEKYFAVDDVQLTYTEGMSMSASTTEPYLYTLIWTTFGTYQFKAVVDEKEYRFIFNVSLPDAGFYSTGLRSESSYIEEEFHFINASEKSQDGTEAYFYLIAPTYDYSLNQISVSFGKWLSEEEIEGNVWTEKKISGMEIGTPQMATFDNENYAVWKITVSDAYQNPYANRQDLRIAYGKEGMSRTKRIIIYDSTEISEEEQLYWFYDSSKIEIDESGKMSLSSDSEESLDGRAYKQIRWNDKSGSMEGYFAVKKNGEYYALRTVQTSETEGISVTEYADTPYLYKVEWSEFGKYHIIATDNEAEYRLNFYAELPKIGFYSTCNRSEETYLDEFYYADAVEKSEDGKEAYFYCIAPTDGFTKSQIRAFFTEYISNEETGEENWEEKSIPGISIAQYETKFFDEKEYVIFQIAVSNQYQYDIEKSYQECIRIVYDKGEGWHADWKYIKMYDASIVPPSQQLYFFDDYNVTLDSDGKLKSKDMDSLSTLERRELFGGNGRSYNGYFAVKEGSEYYAVTPVSVPENVICAKADDDSYSCRITKIGDYEITAAYKGQTYRINAIYSLPSSGFFAKPEKTAENYLYEQFWVQNAIEKSEDGTECYFYLFRDNLDDTESDEIKLMSNSREEGDTAGIKIEVQSKVKKGRINYWIYKITVPITYTAEGNHSESWEMHTDNCRFSIEMFDTGAIRPEQQLHWVYKDDAQIENGKLRPAEGNSTLYPRTEMNLVYNTPWAREGYFAVLKDGEYYPVNNISATDEVTATLDEDSGAFGLVSKHVGEYTITYNDGKQEYYFKSKVVLPTAGCFTSQTYTEEAFIADLFDYNTADENKHFYFIAKENLIKGNSNPDSLQFSITPGDTHDGVGIGVGESGTFERKGETYYYWEIKVDKSFQHSSDYVQYVVQLKDGNYSLYGNMLKIRGYVKYGDIDKNDKTDFADALWLKRYLADWDNYRYIGRREADVDRDGKITASDLMILERHIAGWTGYESLPKVA